MSTATLGAATLPSQGRSRAISDEFLLDLRDDPGVWDLALSDERGGGARGIAHRVNNWGAYGGGYEAKVERRGDKWELWLRWNGPTEPGPTAAAAAVPMPELPAAALTARPEPKVRGYALPLNPPEAIARIVSRVRDCAGMADRVALQRELLRIADELVAIRRAVIEVTVTTPGVTVTPDYGRNCRSRSKNPAPGKRVCSKCGETKDIDEFPFSDRAKGKRRSDCADCYNAGQRTRYVRAGYKIVTVEVVDGDPCVGHPCPGCGQPFEVGQHIQGDNLHHEGCDGGGMR